MKRFALVLLAILTLTVSFALMQTVKKSPYNNENFSVLWKEIIELEKKGLPQTALLKVNSIYEEAKKTNNPEQLIKSIIYILKYTEYKEENSIVNNINKLQSEAESATFPAKPILHSMLAQVYWQYYENNRYRISQRTETRNFKNEDISTWNVEKLVYETIRNYQLSLEDAEPLKNTKIDYFEEILYPNNKSGRHYRPTLYDFLAHRTIDFFLYNEPDVVRPAYSFTINSADYLADAEQFCRLQIASNDTFSFKYYTLKIYQDLIRFHLNDWNPDALADADLKRIEFVYQNLTLPDKDELYINALQNLQKRAGKSSVAALAAFAEATIWYEKGEKYNPSQSEDFKWDTKKSYDLCESIIQRFPDSEGAIKAFNHQQTIKNKAISAELEKVNVPQMPFRALIKYKNFKNLYWRTIKIDRKEIKEYRENERNNNSNDSEKSFLENYIKKVPAGSGQITLPDDGDFQLHSTEIKIDGLPVGDYLLILSNKADFSTNDNNLAYAYTSISNLSYIHRNLDNGSTEVHVLNRTTGEPIAGASVQQYYNSYNTKLNRYELISGEISKTDESGKVVLPFMETKSNRIYYNSFDLKITGNDDTFYTADIDNFWYGNNSQLNQYKNLKEKPRTRTLFFLDRGIYRPGQTVYFKGLLFSGNHESSQIVPNKNQTITFYDANYQIVAKQDITTNEFGTFSGTFTIPLIGRTGSYEIRINDNIGTYAFFQVEEYKRPKFEVSFDAPKGSYSLGDSVTVTGKAMAYSGAQIDGANVQYRIVRKARFPYWWWCWYGYYPSSPEMEITNGSTSTDAIGSYSITFKAIPDESVDKKSDPVFSYVVSADVTDINGETHSNQTTINIGYKSLELGVDISNIDLSDENILKLKFQIHTTNLAGEFQPATGNIAIWKLKNPDRAFRERFWQKPDKHTLTKDEFYKVFPSDQFDEENNFYKWEKEKQAYTLNFKSETDKDFNIPNLKSWKPGKYMLEITSRDKNQQDVKEVVYFDVNDSKANSLEIPSISYLNEIKATCEPGEDAIISIGSSEQVNALYEIERDGQILESQHLLLNNEKRIMRIPIREEYRGNIAVHFTFIKNNRLYAQTSNINVPYTNKQLDIQFETFRDKLQPGQQEQWKLKIKGNKADKAMAEMVATLYDASLDEFRSNNWNASFFNYLYARLGWKSTNCFAADDFRNYSRNWNNNAYKSFKNTEYDYLNWFGFYHLGGYGYGDEIGVYYAPNSVRFTAAVVADEEYEEVSLATADEMVEMKDEVSNEAPPEKLDQALSGMVPGMKVAKSYKAGEIPASGIDSRSSDKAKSDLSGIKARTNFNETAFFYPHLKTNEEGEIIIDFVIPEALTRWKMMGLAHTKDLQSGKIIRELVTQKDLMVVPNQPRFFRENDKMVFSAKITSLADKDLKGEARLEFFDALTMKPISNIIKGNTSQVPFSVKSKQSTNLEWNITIPESIQAISYRIVAKAENFSDGEEMTLPVVTNRMLVTETLPLPISGKQTKTFKLEKLLNSTSSTLRNQRFTLEFTSNPAWYAVQALPYLMEYPYECTEQTFSRYYANSIASHIANSNPKIKKVFDAWKNYQPDVLLSNLEKNQELKSALLEETPWVLNAKDESQRKRNIALLFDFNKMSNEQKSALKKILDAQTGNGGFSWFKGMQEDRYITQHIIAGFGHLDVMGVKEVRGDSKTWKAIQNALKYIDNQMQRQYEYLKLQAQKGYIKLEENNLGYTEIHYLYTRSYFRDIDIPDQCNEGFNYFMEQAKKYWLQNNIYMQGMMVLALNRFDERSIAESILKSLKERALYNEEMGMYWKSERGYYWYEAPIETQALMIEVFEEVAKDQKCVDELKIWLLKQKQTQDWRTTKATSEACYALLRKGTNILATDTLIEVTVGKEKISPLKREDIKVEAGTGYFKTAWTANEITPEMGNIKVSKKDEGVAWGVVYWQYFEQLDKITPTETPLKIDKKLFLQQNTDRGPVITPITENTKLKVGDLVKVRIEIRVDRSMEYIHLKDMRAACFEPTETISTYKYQDGLSYYQSTHDLSTNFFMGWLPKGTHVFEYPLRVSQKGDFSNGITTIQCMYAPEYSSHSEGIRVKVE